MGAFAALVYLKVQCLLGSSNSNVYFQLSLKAWTSIFPYEYESESNLKAISTQLISEIGLSNKSNFNEFLLPNSA